MTDNAVFVIEELNRLEFDIRQAAAELLKEQHPVPSTTSVAHDDWYQKSVADGWTEGEYNEEQKTSPELMPWEALPRPLQFKKRLDALISEAKQRIAERMI